MIGPVSFRWAAWADYSRERLSVGHLDGLKPLDWVIVGGESGRGPNIRPMHPDWARQVRDDCAAAGVPFFFKQWGEWREVEFSHVSVSAVQCGEQVQPFGPSGPYLARVGKREAGGELDGVVHHAWPETRT